MKNLFFGLMFIFSISITANSISATDECFDFAVDSLVDMENTLGFQMDDATGTYYLNDFYMQCWCLSHIEYCLENW